MKIRLLMVALCAGALAVFAAEEGCTPQQAKAIENGVLTAADAACIAENALKLVDDAAVLAFCKIEPQLADAAKGLMAGTRAGVAKIGCASGRPSK